MNTNTVSCCGGKGSTCIHGGVCIYTHTCKHTGICTYARIYIHAQALTYESAYVCVFAGCDCYGIPRIPRHCVPIHNLDEDARECFGL